MPSAMPCSDIASLFSAHHSALKVDYFCLLSLLPTLRKHTACREDSLSLGTLFLYVALCCLFTFGSLHLIAISYC